MAKSSENDLNTKISLTQKQKSPQIMPPEAKS